MVSVIAKIQVEWLLKTQVRTTLEAWTNLYGRFIAPAIIVVLLRKEYGIDRSESEMTCCNSINVFYITTC